MTQTASVFPRALSLPVTDMLDERTRDAFDQFGNEKHSVKWYGAPPGGGVEHAPLMHSVEYLAMEREMAMEGDDVVMHENVAFVGEEAGGDVEVLGVRLEGGVEQSVEEKWAPVNEILHGKLSGV
jgi:hypothetical protein